MALVNLEDILRRAHQMADVPRESTTRADATITPQELTDVVNDGLAELHDLLVSVYEDWLTTSETLAMVAAQPWTQLPADFFKARELMLIESGTRCRLTRFRLDDLDGSTTTDTSSRPQYRIMGTKIHWAPAPGGAYSVELWYVRQLRRLVDSADEITPELPAGWEVFPIAHAAAYMLGKMERDPQLAMLQKQMAGDRIKSAARTRDAGQPMEVRSTSGRFDGPRRRYPYPRR